MDGILDNNIILDSINDSNHLVNSAIKGSKEDFISLIDFYKEYLYKTAFLYVKDETHASDIYQETIYKAYLGIAKLKKPEFFKTWITKILINTAKDKLKQIKKEVASVKLEECLSISVNESISIEEKIDLYNAIDCLNEKYKSPIILKYFHDMSIKEISKVLDTKENTIKSLIHRGKAILLNNLKGDL